ncbi:ferritin family protein [Chloroflexota bacterium]
MPIHFPASELINLAMGIEKQGVVFYDIMARSTEESATRQVFQYLAEMEREHIQIFQNMLGEAGKYQISDAYTKESATYFQTLIDSAVFTEDMATSEMATKVDNDISALELGISAEKDSLLFYYEMRETMTESAHPVINKIIAEEKLHLNQLIELKKRLSNVRSQDTE